MATSAPLSQLEDLRSPDQSRQNHAFQTLMKATDEPVPWAYEVWDELLRILVNGDNRQRSISAQVLSNLARSDSTGRMVRDVAVLIAATKDERFVTARHCLQSLWKVGVVAAPQRAVLMKGLAKRFRECALEKNGTLIRYDILVVMRRVYDQVHDEGIRTAAGTLMALETNPTYRQKYAAAWRS